MSREESDVQNDYFIELEEDNKLIEDSTGESMTAPASEPDPTFFFHHKKSKKVIADKSKSFLNHYFCMEVWGYQRFLKVIMCSVHCEENLIVMELGTLSNILLEIPNYGQRLKV